MARKFFLGLVTDSTGKERPQSGYITYGITSDPDDETGEIEINGEDAPRIAALICKLLNEQ